MRTEKKPLWHSGLTLPALLAAAVWLGGGHLLKANVIDGHNAQSVRQASQQIADNYAQQLQQFFSQRQQQLRGLKPLHTSSTSSGTSALPDASLQFFTPEQLHVGAGQPPLNFALVDLLKRSREEQQPKPEFLRNQENQWQLYSASAEANGALLISQPFRVFEQTLNRLDQNPGTIQLNQQFPDGPARGLWSSPAVASGGEAASAAVSGSYLNVSFIPSPAFARSHSIPASWVYGAALLGLLGTLLALWILLPADGAAAPWEKSARSGRTAAKRSLSKEDLAKPPAATNQSTAVAEAPAPAAPAAPAVEETSRSDLMRTPSTEIPAHVFRAYDIRGIAGEEINEPFAYQLGRALGSIALQSGQELLLVGRDGRNSSELLRDCLIEGILESGCNAVDLGLVPSPLLYFACAKGKNTSSGVMVTASHNPAEYNGFKIVMNGRPLADDKLQDLRTLMQSGQFASGKGSHNFQDINSLYIDEIFNDVALAGQPRIVIDAGNGATSELAPELFEQLGCAVETLYCEVDGNFPNHAPDPSRPENLQDLITAVKGEGADLGIALDGDGDRVTLITPSGRIVWADQLVMLLARDILARNPGSDIVFDVKSSRALADLVTQYGGRPVMWKTGHAPMKTKMLETGALLGGELSGHIFIKDRWYGFDDGIYAAARVLEIMALREQSLDELLDSLPQMVNTPEILLPVPEQRKFGLIDKLRKQGHFGDADLNTIDGLRIEFADGWGLVRASNTSAALTLRFEADDEQALERIRKIVAIQLQSIDPALKIPG
ncbi:phosphomannomutase/phosphoglucomutase [Microbulbifer sp. CAU 1566]|uniref:phosphomannomutase/phosphoglucomutase n=1 Tax=Microbulbifer sp. CAU 1566 TaxID=2933269 RepID=UPI0020048DAC|nr:phosphomannomutase/phosphoglucomutase [Microbulbifer sp. CAU 1566]MCK7597949.1 phosphomannomutase/phosphoglucomutase [Microbulbifer sp. CAU 1566]